VGGVLVVRAEKNGPGARTGLQAGDVLLRAGQPVASAAGRTTWAMTDLKSLDDLAQFLAQVKPGSHVLVQVLRDGRELRGDLETR
jgi:S1-C subfamily serine protease